MFTVWCYRHCLAGWVGWLEPWLQAMVAGGQAWEQVLGLRCCCPSGSSFDARRFYQVAAYHSGCDRQEQPKIAVLARMLGAKDSLCA